MLNGTQQRMHAVKIETVESEVMQRILDVRDMLAKGLSLEKRAPKTLEEVLADMDPLFARLLREKLDAAQLVASLKAAGPSQEAMLDMAKWQAESAESAYDTRMIELRADVRLMEEARFVLTLELKQEEYLEKKRKELEAQRKALIEEEAQLLKLRKELAARRERGQNMVMMFVGVTILGWIERQRRRFDNVKQLSQELVSASTSAFTARKAIA